MIVAVTGGKGFIGRAVVKELEQQGHRAVPLDVPDYDVRRPDVVRPVYDADAVIHLAGVLGTSELWAKAAHAIDVNVKGTLNVLGACQHGHTAYVGISVPDCWLNVYQATKLAAQRLALGFNRDFGVPVTHIKAFNAYGAAQKHGPRHPQKIIPTFATMAHERKPIPIWGDGHQTVDLVHVDHIARCLVDAAVSGHAAYGDGQEWDAGSGVQARVLDVAYRVAHAAGWDDPEILHLPMRTGETPNTLLCATNPGPLGYDEQHRLAEVVESYSSASLTVA